MLRVSILIRCRWIGSSIHLMLAQQAGAFTRFANSYIATSHLRWIRSFASEHAPTDSSGAWSTSEVGDTWHCGFGTTTDMATPRDRSRRNGCDAICSHRYHETEQSFRVARHVSRLSCVRYLPGCFRVVRTPPSCERCISVWLRIAEDEWLPKSGRYIIMLVS